MSKTVALSVVLGCDVLQHVVSTKVRNTVTAKSAPVFELSVGNGGTKRKSINAPQTDEKNDQTESSSEEEDVLTTYEDPLNQSSSCIKSHKKSRLLSKVLNKSKDEGIQNEARSYFNGHSKVTSDHQLSRIAGQMNYDQLAAELENFRYQHEGELVTLKKEHQQLFHNWMYHLSTGTNLLLFGAGSKYHLLDRFLTTVAKDYTRVVINGYFPGITVKSILNAITEDALGHSDSFASVIDQCEFLRRCFDVGGIKDLLLVVHNIDGTSLQSRKMQMVLCLIAKIPGIHVVASVDHVNCSLLWDQVTLSQFNWVYFDVTSYDCYENETAFENSMLVQQTAILQLSSLQHVLNSLTQNAQSIFRILASYQLDHCSSSAYIGLSFPDLYQKCRESFLVSSDLTLHSQLTEFHDHKLIRIKKGVDGVEYVTILLEESALSEFLQLHQDG